MSSVRAKADPRNRELARIHILAKQLGLNDAAYEAVLWETAKVDSAKQLDAAGRRTVIAHMEGRLPAKARRYPRRPANIDRRDMLKKVEALLTDAGREWAYAEALAKRMYKRDRLEFCGDRELTGIVTALEKDALKRLSTALKTELGEGWIEHATRILQQLRGWPSSKNIEKYSEPMSFVVRWLRGERNPACDWHSESPMTGTMCNGCRTRQAQAAL